MNRVKLSICITVYNQLELVKANLARLIQYQGKDVEFIVSDDVSSDPIEEMVKSLGDDRIRYIRGTKNIGHDMNILQALDNCSGEYAMILRSRDTVYPEKIEAVLKVLNQYSDASYYVFSANDEKGDAKLRFSDRVYTPGTAAAVAHSKIFVHPSGNLYNMKYLPRDVLNSLRSVMRSSFDDIYGFVVHDLIRMYLADQGCFVTSKEIVWEYVNTAKAQDKAVNSLKSRKSVYAPSYEYARYQCEFKFIAARFNGKTKMLFFRNIIRRFYKSVTMDFALSNKNVQMQEHYNYEAVNHSPRAERKNFIQVSKELFTGLPNNEKKLLHLEVAKQTLLQLTYYPIKAKLLHLLRDYRHLTTFIKLFKRI